MTPTIRDGASRWGMLFVAVGLPPLLAAPVRVVLAAPTSVAMAVALIPSLAIAWWLGRHLPPDSSEPRVQSVKQLVPLALAVASCATLYSRALSGLSAWVGTDPGNHAAIRRAFIESRDTVYGGFASMYLAWHMVERLTHLDAFRSFAVLFYGEVILLAVVPLFIAHSVLRPLRGDARLAERGDGDVAVGGCNPAPGCVAAAALFPDRWILEPDLRLGSADDDLVAGCHAPLLVASPPDLDDRCGAVSLHLWAQSRRALLRLRLRGPE